MYTQMFDVLFKTFSDERMICCYGNNNAWNPIG